MAIHTESIDFPANGGTGQGYLALPEGDGPHRAVVVIQEWWGLNDHIKDIARAHTYRPEAAKDAWARTLAWFDTYLG